VGLQTRKEKIIIHYNNLVLIKVKISYQDPKAEETVKLII